jgi:hypothetical protein
LFVVVVGEVPEDVCGRRFDAPDGIRAAATRSRLLR